MSAVNAWTQCQRRPLNIVAYDSDERWSHTCQRRTLKHICKVQRRACKAQRQALKHTCKVQRRTLKHIYKVQRRALHFHIDASVERSKNVIAMVAMWWMFVSNRRETTTSIATHGTLHARQRAHRLRQLFTSKRHRRSTKWSSGAFGYGAFVEAEKRRAPSRLHTQMLSHNTK